MTDYKCIPVDHITAPYSDTLLRITDTNGRDWFCATQAALTDEVKEKLGGSEYAWAGWMTEQINSFLSALGLARSNSLFGDWDDKTRQVVDSTHDVCGETEQSLASTLSEFDINSTQVIPIDLRNLKAVDSLQRNVVNAEHRPKRRHLKVGKGLKRKQRRESIALPQKIGRILEKHNDYGWKRSRSGELNMNGRDYALDIISAVQYVGSLLSDIQEPTVSVVVQLLESHKEEYEHIYTDLEGFGCGTINGIIEDIEKLQSVQ